MKKQYIFLGVIILFVASVTTLAVYKYNQQPKGETLSQAVARRKTAEYDLYLQKQLNANDKQAVVHLTEDKQTLSVELQTLCVQIKTAKLVQPLCK